MRRGSFFLLVLLLLTGCGGSGGGGGESPTGLETDTDGDGIPDRSDNCRTTADPTGQDTDGDGVGDVCDNCPDRATSNQTDTDGDGIGDACDETSGSDFQPLLDCAASWPLSEDGTVVEITVEPALGGPQYSIRVRNPAGMEVAVFNSSATFDDGSFVPCRVSRTTFRDAVHAGVPEGDYDRDTVLNGSRLPPRDNCVEVKNRNQEDSDGNGIGDRCDEFD